MSVQEVIMTRRNGYERREKRYGRRIRLAAAAALSLVIAGFLFVRMPETRAYVGVRTDSLVTIFAPPPGPVPPPPPPKRAPKPRLPVVSDDGKDVDPGKTDGWDPFKVSPKDPVLDGYKPWEVEFQPVPVAVPTPEYPSLARAAGIEGTAVVEALVDTTGAVCKVKLGHGSGNRALDEAAMDAARRACFEPGRQGASLVRVWVAIPFQFGCTR